jgi:hypothetical protein
VKALETLYSDIRDALLREQPELAAEFEQRAAADTPMNVFLWLQRLSEEHQLPPELEPTLTDFFFSIH